MKYVNSEGLQKSRVLFGYPFVDIKTRGGLLCITEGQLNTMWLWQHGYNSVALMGKDMSEYQLRLLLKLKGVTEVCLCLDNDEAGRDGTEKVKQKLTKYLLVSYIFLTKEYNDVQDIRNSEQLHTTINERKILF